MVCKFYSFDVRITKLFWIWSWFYRQKLLNMTVRLEDGSGPKFFILFWLFRMRNWYFPFILQTRQPKDQDHRQMMRYGLHLFFLLSLELMLYSLIRSDQHPAPTPKWTKKEVGRHVSNFHSWHPWTHGCRRRSHSAYYVFCTYVDEALLLRRTSTQVMKHSPPYHLCFTENGMTCRHLMVWQRQECSKIQNIYRREVMSGKKIDSRIGDSINLV